MDPESASMTVSPSAEKPSPAVDTVPIARVLGEPVRELPRDLYIPPDALEVVLETFEGPLDLLLYLIRRNNLSILDIPIARITRQYVEYIEMMRELRLELAAEYLVMAAMLAEIKSRMLLPRPVEVDEEAEDPRAELIRRLQEYERYKKAAEDLDELPRVGRDTFTGRVEAPPRAGAAPLPQVELNELLAAFKAVLERAELLDHHHIQREPLSIRERMTRILGRLADCEFLEFGTLFDPAEGRAGVVVTLLALLELIKEQLVDVVQPEPYAHIHLRPKAAAAVPIEPVVDHG